MDESLFHYCSTKSLVSIITNKSIWLSSLALANDIKEGKVVSEIIRKLAEKDRMSEPHKEILIASITNVEKIIHGLGLCLSEERDLLSQWRGYADDGRGVCIGFSKKFIQNLAETKSDDKKVIYSLHKVIYESSKQIERLEPAYEEIKKLIDDGAYSIPSKRGLLDSRTDEEITRGNTEIEGKYRKMFPSVLKLISNFYILKNTAFREEKEWRLISNLVLTVNNDSCMFRADRDKVVPYRELQLEPFETSPITEVILGPKNISTTETIQALLERHGFSDVVVKFSESSYR